MDEQQYGVDSFHINVGPGDCAIHLLTSFTYDTVSGLETLPTIEKAVIVDFGYQQGSAWGSGYEGLNRTLQVICAKYQLTSVADIKFDAVVITHWDLDHYGGLWSWIQHDMYEQWEALGATQRAALGLRSWMNNTYRCQHFKFSGTSNNGQPQTVLIAPTLPPEYLDSTIQESCSILWQSPASNGDWVQLPVGLPRPTGYRDDLKFQIKFNNWSPNIGGYTWQFGRNSFYTGAQCRFIFDPKLLLGKNIFSPTALTTDPPIQINNANTVLQLMGLSPPSPDNTAPGLYIVAVNSVVMPTFHAVSNPTNNKNNTSIAMIISWLYEEPQSADQTTSISHYFAGDLDTVTEGHLGVWLVPDADNKETSIKTMKLSHHGALTGTPPSLVYAANPTSLIVSAGKKYGHPRWELILLLDSVMSSMSQIYATRYPYYFSGVQTNPHAGPAGPVDLSGDRVGFSSFLASIGVSDEPPRRLFDAKRFQAELGQYGSSAYTNFEEEFARNPKDNINDGLVKIVMQNGNTEYPLNIPQNAAANSQASQQAMNITNLTQENIEIEGEDASSVLYSNDTNLILATAQPLSSGSGSPNQSQIYGRQSFSTSYYSLSLFFPGSIRRLPWVPVLVDAGSYSCPIGFDPGENENLLEDVESSLKTPSTDVAPQLADFPPTPQTPRVIQGTSNSPYYLFSNSIAPPTTEDTIQILASTLPLNEFITTLHRGVLGLNSAPKAGSPIPVVPSDEVLSWFQLIFGSSSTISVTGDAQNNLSGFQIMVPRAPGSSDVKKYLSSNISNVFGTVSDGDAIDPCGLLTQENILVLGLDPPDAAAKTNYSTNLQQVFTLAGQTSVLSNPILAAAASGIALEIDISDGSRNGLWFAPEDAYRVVVRTQYTCPSVQSKSLVGWFGANPDLLEIASLTVVTKEQWRMKSVDTTLPPNGRIMYSSDVRMSIVVNLTITNDGTSSPASTTSGNNTSGTTGTNSGINTSGTTITNSGTNTSGTTDTNSGTNTSGTTSTIGNNSNETGTSGGTTTMNQKVVSITGVLEVQNSSTMFQLQIDDAISLSDIVSWGDECLGIKLSVKIDRQAAPSNCDSTASSSSSIDVESANSATINPVSSFAIKPVGIFGIYQISCFKCCSGQWERHF
ncbi:hypothetical protein ABW20_dc0100752 [Dactylellina cionopaga]|nr:hypothetical protein ABW20_dc0100752 [Dactylellina cionopaga]